MKIEAAICLIIVAGLLAVAIPNHHAGMVRPKVRYVLSCFSDFRYEQKEALYSNAAAVLPTRFPLSFLHPDRAEGTHYADPFDVKNRSGVERVYCKAHPLHGNGELVDFNFWGNPFKYYRLSDRRALIASYGPDEDNDFTKLTALEIKSLTTATVQATLSALTYDSTNGTITNGDCWRFIDLDDEAPEAFNKTPLTTGVSR